MHDENETNATIKDENSGYVQIKVAMADTEVHFKLKRTAPLGKIFLILYRRQNDEDFLRRIYLFNIRDVICPKQELGLYMTGGDSKRWPRLTTSYSNQI